MKYYEATISLDGRNTTTQDWRMGNQSWNEKIQFLYETKYGCDVNIKIKNREGEEVFRAHRFVLSMSSNVLEQIINSDVFKIPGDATIVFTNISPEVINIFLNFVYTKNGKPETSLHAIELYRIAAKLNVPDLKDIARKYIEKHLDISSILDIYILADNNDLFELKDRCALIIQKQTEEIINSTNILDLDVHSLIVILDQPALNIKESDLFKLIRKWMSERKKTAIKSGCEDPEARKKLNNCLVTRFRFLSMSAEEFSNGPMKTKLLSNEQKLAILGHITSKTCTLKFPPGFSCGTRKYLGGSVSPKRIEPKESPRKQSSPIVVRKKTPSTYRINEEGDTPPPTIGLQRISDITPSRIRNLLPSDLAVRKNK